MTHLICIDCLAFGDFVNFIFLPIFCLLIDKTDVFLAETGMIGPSVTFSEQQWPVCSV